MGYFLCLLVIFTPGLKSEMKREQRTCMYTLHGIFVIRTPSGMFDVM